MEEKSEIQLVESQADKNLIKSVMFP